MPDVFTKAKRSEVMAAIRSQGKPESHPVENAAHHFLRRGIPATDPAHVPTAMLRGEGVGHEQ